MFRAFNQAAKLLGVYVNAVKAVYEVETEDKVFLPNGDPKTLFERHKFYKYTNKQCKLSDICQSKRGGYGKFSAQLGKLKRASKINKKAAYFSTSFGGFQIMGFNYKDAGYSNVYDFAEDMLSKDEDKHLMAFCNVVAHDKKKTKYLKNKNWAGFARRYNGPKYKDNHYDTKLKKAYNEAKKRK